MINFKKKLNLSHNFNKTSRSFDKKFKLADRSFLEFKLSDCVATIILNIENKTLRPFGQFYNPTLTNGKFKKMI